MKLFDNKLQGHRITLKCDEDIIMGMSVDNPITNKEELVVFVREVLDMLEAKSIPIGDDEII